jgi:hypothetical protein
LFFFELGYLLLADARTLRGDLLPTSFSLDKGRGCYEFTAGEFSAGREFDREM